jgi:hypothetical protein
MKAARAAGIVSIIAAAAVIAGAAFGAHAVVYGAAIVSAIAGAAVLFASPRNVPEASAEPAAQPKPKREPAATVLLATLRNVDEGSERLVGDLQTVLAGIIADERGKIDRSEPHSLVAVFARGEHAGAAVHAARRMVSNVDAVSRRLGHGLGIAIAIHSAPRGEEAISVAARVQEAATETVPILVSAPAAASLANELERVDTVAADGWSLDVFTIPPAQKRLPGF